MAEQARHLEPLPFHPHISLSCLRLLLLLPTPTFRPNVTRSFLGEIYITERLGFADATGHSGGVLEDCWSGYITRPNSVGTFLFVHPARLTSFHMGNPGTANSILPSQFPTWMQSCCWGRGWGWGWDGCSEFTGAAPFPPLGSGGDSNSRLWEVHQARCGQRTGSSCPAQGLCLVTVNPQLCDSLEWQQNPVPGGCPGCKHSCPLWGLAGLPWWP